MKKKHNFKTMRFTPNFRVFLDMETVSSFLNGWLLFTLALGRTNFIQIEFTL